MMLRLPAGTPKLEVSGLPPVIEGWAAHASGKRFRISAEIIQAEPFDGSAELTNAALVRFP